MNHSTGFANASFARAQAEHDNAYDRRDDAVSEQQHIDDQRTALRDEIHDQILALSKTVAKLDDLDDRASDIPTVDELLSFLRGERMVTNA